MGTKVIWLIIQTGMIEFNPHFKGLSVAYNRLSYIEKSTKK